MTPVESLTPITSLVILAGLGGSALLLSYEAYGPGIMLGIAPLLSISLAALAVAVVVALKWMVIGKFKPVIVPLWCPYVWLNEMVNGAYETMMAPVISLCFGTPFAAWLLRLLGCRLGRHSFIATSLFSEFDLVRIGDCVALNSGAVIQNHLFEDRIMKSSNLHIDHGCSVGNMSVVLYDTHMPAWRHPGSAFPSHERRDRAAGRPLAWHSHRKRACRHQFQLSEGFHFARRQQHFPLFSNTLNLNYRGSLWVSWSAPRAWWGSAALACRCGRAADCDRMLGAICRHDRK